MEDGKLILDFYHGEMPAYLLEFCESEAMQRLKGTGMDCGCEYTSFPLFQSLPIYNRYMHSLGVALIVHHFTGDRKQALSALFHDIATPAFAHVVDFLNHDHMHQESTEERTEQIIREDQRIQFLLNQYGLTTEEVRDYHLYPVADNDAPSLSADRLEYSLVNSFRYLKRDRETLKSYYEDLQVGRNEYGEVELVFKEERTAEAYALDALYSGMIYSSDADRYAMEYLAQIMRQAIVKGVLNREDLYSDEKKVIALLNKDEECQKMFERFRRLHKIHRSEKKEGEMSFNINVKKRYVDPYVKNRGRVSQLSERFRKEKEAFLSLDYDCWLKGE